MAENINQQDPLKDITNAADFTGPAKLGVNLPSFQPILPQNTDYLITDNTVGSAPNVPSKNIQAFQDPNNNLAQATAEKLKSIFDGSVDDTQYNKPYLYDSSPTGAHKARYKAYGQETYDRIGFRPDIDNEAWFNQNTTQWDNFKRMLRVSARPLLGLGFIDPIKSYGKILSDFDFSGDPNSAALYEEYTNLGYSTKGGLGGFFTNLTMSAAYSLGIMMEGVVEGALIGGAVGFMEGGVGAIPGAALGGVTGGFKNLIKAPGAIMDASKNIAKMLSNLEKMKDINVARNVWKNAGKTMGNFINPFSNTTDAFQKYVFNNADDLSNLARASRTMGGFLYDVRNINMALSEGRLEGGFSENAVYQKLYNDYYKEHGVVAPDELQKQFRNQAKRASFSNTLFNTGLIFLTNKISFPSMMNARFLKGVPKFSKVAGKIGDYNLIYKPGKAVEEGLWYAEKASLVNSLKALKSPSTYGRSFINYFKANITEGIQEVSQDILQDSVTRYYTETFNNPAVKTQYYTLGLLKDSFDKSMSAEGFETFMSGFMMGTILKGPQKVMNFASNQINKFKNREAYNEYKTQYETVAQDAVNALNEMTKNGKFFLDPRLQNYGTQYKIAQLVDNEDKVTTEEAKDAEFESFYSNVRTAIQTGTFDLFLKNFEGFKQYTPKELEEAWNLKEGQGELALANLDKAIANARVIKNRFEYFTKKFKPGPNPADFPEGSLDQMKAMLYNKAYNISINNAVWMGSSFDENLQRVNKLVDKISKIESIQNSRFGTFSAIYDTTSVDPETGRVILSTQKLDTEIELLRSETESLKQTGDAKAQGQINNNELLINALEEFKAARLLYDETLQNKKALEAVSEILKAVEEETQAEDFTQRLKEETDSSEATLNYKKAFENLLKTLAKIQGGQSIANTEVDLANNMDEYFTDLIDLHVLNKTKNALTGYINILADPEGFYEHVNRNYEWVKREYQNRKETFKKIINDEFHNEIKNDLLKNLAEKGIYVDLDQFADWVEDNSKLPEYFIDVNNEASITKDSIFYNEYAKMFIEAADLLSKNPAGDPATAEENLNEQLEELEKEKVEKLQKAYDKYEADLKKLTGFTEKEIKERNKLAENQNTEDIEALKAKIEEAKAVLKDLRSDDLTVFNEIQERIFKVITLRDEDINEYLNNLDDATFKKLDRNASIRLNRIRKQLPEDQRDDIAILERIKSALFILETVKAQKSIDAEIEKLEKELSEKDTASGIEIIDIESLPVYQEYQREVARINEEYAAVEKDLKASIGPVSTDIKPMSTDMEWDELDPELRIKLQPLFIKFLSGIGLTAELQDTDEEQYNKIRREWLETQGEIINQYNETKKAQVAARREKMSTAPEFKFLEIDINLNVTSLNNLNDNLDYLNQLLSTGTIEVSTGPEEKDKEIVPLSKTQLADIQADKEALTFYIENRRNNFVPLKEYEKVLLDIQEKILDRQNEIEIIRDEEGKVIGRRLKTQPEGTTLARPSKLAEEIDYEINDKTPYEYKRKGLILKAFDNAQDPNIKDSDRFDFFIREFTNLRLAAYPLSKIKKLAEELKINFTKENLDRLIDKYTNIESTDTGTLIDDLARTFLTPNPKGGFMPISKPDNMSQEAFDSLFGVSGIVTRIRDGMIDGDYHIIANNFTIFDSRLGENGIAGEVDILAIKVDKETGKAQLQIIDIKTSKNWSSWETGGDFDTSTKYRAQQSIYKNIVYNMSGLDASIHLLALQVSVNTEGYISKVGLAPFVNEQNTKRVDEGLKPLDTFQLKYLPEVENKGIIKIEPKFETPTVTSTDIEAKKADIERRSGEPIKDFINRLFENKYLVEVDGKQLFNLTQGRWGVVVNINGVKVPFYQSTSGTETKTAGQWYPFFGDQGNWVIKGNSDDSNVGYGFKAIQDVQSFLNKNIKEKDAISTSGLISSEVLQNQGSLRRLDEDKIKGNKKISLNKEATAKRLSELMGYTLEEGRKTKSDAELFALASKKVFSELASLEGTQITPEQQAQENNIEAKKADIERRREEELNENNFRIRDKIEVWEYTNYDGKREQIQIIYYADGTKEGRALDENGKNLGTIFKGIQQEVPMDKLLPFEDFTLISTEANPATAIADRINAKYDAELAALEGKAEVGTTSDQVEEADSKDYTLKEALNKPVIYNGSEGILTLNPDGTYTVEITEGEITRIEDIILNGLPVKDGSILLSGLGISVIRSIEQPGQVTVVNNELLDVKFANKSETQAIINGVTYKVNRDSSGSIVSFTYRANDKAIQDIDQQLGLLNEELKTVRNNLRDVQDDKTRTTLLTKEINVEDEIKSLVAKRKELFDNNPERTLRGQKANDYIFALNKLPNSYQKNSAKDTKVDTVRDSKTISSISAVSTVADAITNMMAEEYPSEVDKLLEQGIDSITIEDLFRIVNWGQNTIAKLEAYALNLIDRNIPITDVEDQIAGLRTFLNDLKLINITKDGRISKRQKQAREIFKPGNKGVSQRTDISPDAGVVSGQTETISGPTTTEEVEKSIKTIRTPAKTTLTEDEALLLSVLETEENIQKEKPEVIKNLEAATTKEDLDKARAQALLYIIRNPGQLTSQDITNIYKSKLKEILVDINANSITKNMHLMGLVPIFTDKVGDIVYIKSIRGNNVTVQDIHSKKTMKFTIEELAEKFTKTTEMAIEEKTTEAPVVISEETQESIESNDDVLNSIDENEITDRIKTTKISRLDAFNKLNNNSNKC